MSIHIDPTTGELVGIDTGAAHSPATIVSLNVRCPGCGSRVIIHTHPEEELGIYTGQLWIGRTQCSNSCGWSPAAQ